MLACEVYVPATDTTRCLQGRFRARCDTCLAANSFAQRRQSCSRNVLCNFTRDRPVQCKGALTPVAA